ncbi:MAG: sodium:solute symporter family protein [Planctomycetota bacterium]
MGLVDYLMVGTFFAAMLAVGASLRRWVGNPDDFYVAGRMLPPAILAATLAATNINLYNFVGYSGKAYEYGISIVWHEWTGLMCLALSGLLVLPLLRRLEPRTLPEFLEMRFSRAVRVLVAVLWLLRLAFVMGIVLYLSGVVAQQVTDTVNSEIAGINSYVWWVTVFTVVAIVMTIMGGAWSVAIGDALQFVLLLGGFLVMFPVIISEVGGVTSLVERLPEARFALVPREGPFNWAFIVAIWLCGVQWACTDQTMLQRGFAARGARTVARGMVLSGVIMVPYALLIVLPGMVSSLLHPGLENPDAAVPVLVSRLPSILLGTVLCGFLASQISTLDAQVNSGATLFTNDLFPFMCRRALAPHAIVRVARLSTLALGALSGAVACFIVPLYRGAVEAYLDLIAILDMPLFVVAIVYGLFWKRANGPGAFVGYLGGAVAAFAMSHLVIDHWLGAAVGLKSEASPVLGFARFLVENKVLAVTLTGVVVSLALCPLVSLLAAPPSASKVAAVWRSREGDAGEAACGESFNVIPRSTLGRFWLGLFFASLAVFLVGVLLGAAGSSLASPLAIGGMVVYFVAALGRLYSD